MSSVFGGAVVRSELHSVAFANAKIPDTAAVVAHGRVESRRESAQSIIARFHAQFAIVLDVGLGDFQNFGSRRFASPPEY